MAPAKNTTMNTGTPGALGASLTLGTAWAAWHVIPYLQAHNSITWRAWQCLATVGLRVFIVWIFNNTSGSVFAAISFHTMVNICDFIFPNYGSNYDPEVFAIIIAVAVGQRTDHVDRPAQTFMHNLAELKQCDPDHDAIGPPAAGCGPGG
jgi:hypothetical protein